MQAELLVSTGKIRSSQDAERHLLPVASERVFGGMFLSFDARE
jgi:hypothetical protein